MNKPINIIFTIGMQASGKSTWAKQFILDNPDYRRINRDEIRRMINGYVMNDKNEDQVTYIERDLIARFIRGGYNVIIDNMNLNEKYVNDYIDFISHAVSSNTSFEFKYFPITLSEAISRDKNRPDSLGEAILKRTWRKYEIELKKMIENSKVHVVEDKSLPYCIICDIDGTLANSCNRRTFDEQSVGGDSPIFSTIYLLSLIHFYNEMAKIGEKKLEIILMSGRQDSCREETEKWLDKNLVAYNKLYMRKAGDHRKDDIIKEELYNEHIKGKYNVHFVIDDRPRVLEKWVSLGLFTLNVNQTPYVTEDGKGDF